MIHGNCPYKDCEEDFLVDIEGVENLPRYWRHKCEACDQTIYTKLSRIDPESWTEEEFNRLYEINWETKVIKEKWNEENESID
jgi:hypothetical protein